MARFAGKVGFGLTVETAPGVWEDTITEYVYFGEVLRNTLKSQEGQKVNNDLSVSNSISIVADAFAHEHIFAIRYVEWVGALWTITDVEIQSPRLLLRLGVKYNGPTGTAPSSP